MKVVGLLSGGKDSCFNLCHCVAQGHQLVALATLTPPEGKDECDSYMYQTVGHDAVHLVAQAMGLPLYRQTITGKALNQSSIYGSRSKPSSSSSSSPDQPSSNQDHDETDDLLSLLLKVKAHHPDIDALSAGAILSNYQRIRVEHVAFHPSLNLTPLTYLWQHSQRQLLVDMERAGLEAVLIKVAGIGLGDKDLGKSLRMMRPKLEKLNGLYGAHVAGEGGEYETLTLDCPLFKRRIEFVETEVVIHSEASFASVSYLKIKSAKLVEKSAPLESKLEHVELGKVIPNLARTPELDFVGRATERVAREAAVSSSSTPPTSTSTTLTSKENLTLTSTKWSSSTISVSGKWMAVGNVTPNLSHTDPSSNRNMEDEVNSAFDILEEHLSKHQLSTPHITHLNLYLSDQSLFSRINAVYSKRFGSAPPSRACVGISSDPAGPLIRIDILAFDDGTRYPSSSTDTTLDSSRKSLHVQGRSYWAPANIGPYSQAVTAGSRISIAGQIGLIPATLQLPTSTAAQIALSLQHARRILAAVLEGEGVKKGRDETQSSYSDVQGWVEGIICWLVVNGFEESDSSSQERGESFTSSLLSMAQSAWEYQSKIEVPDDEAETEHEVQMGELEAEWQSNWTGPRSKGKSKRIDEIPAVYAFVPKESLPRSAKVEWQLTAHTGQPVQNEDDDGEEMALPESETGSFTLGNSGISGKWCVRGSSSGKTAFGVAGLSLENGSKVDDQPPAALQEHLKKALSIRVFYSTRNGITSSNACAVLEKMLALSEPNICLPAVTLVPVQSLFVPSLAVREKGSCDVAIVFTQVG